MNKKQLKESLLGYKVKTQTKIPYPKWEYRVDKKPNDIYSHESEELNNQGEDGWILAGIDGDYYIYMREIEEVKEENPWADTHKKWVKYNSILRVHLDNIKNRIPKLYEAMDAFYGSSEKSSQLWGSSMSFHALVSGVNCVNTEPGAAQSGVAADAGEMFLALTKFQKETYQFDNIIELIKIDCDIVFYRLKGYDIRDAHLAPDMLGYFFSTGFIGKLRAAIIWINVFLAGMVFSVPIVGLAIFIINMMRHFMDNESWVLADHCTMVKYCEPFWLNTIAVGASFVLADSFADKIKSSAILFGWRKLTWAPFIIRSRLARWTRKLTRPSIIGLPIVLWTLYVAILLWAVITKCVFISASPIPEPKQVVPAVMSSYQPKQAKCH